MQIGTGHVMRCLTLADGLRERGARSIFICRPHAGHLLDLIKQRGHIALALAPAEHVLTAPGPADPQHAHWLGTGWDSDAAQTREVLSDQVLDWLVVDHYAIDRRWEDVMRPCTRRVMAIDDLADRPHECDMLLDQNLGRRAEHYGGLLKRHTQTLIGPEFALLRPEFAQWREHSLQRRENPQLKNLLITMGGVDQANVTGRVLDALNRCDLPADLRVTVVMGVCSPWLAQVKTQAAVMPRPTQVLTGVSNMAQLMAESDLCIGAAGGSAWERCALGLPTLVMILAANQHSGAAALQAHGAALLANDSQQLMTQMFSLFGGGKTTEVLWKMSQAAAQLTSGNGASKVVEFLLGTHG